MQKYTISRKRCNRCGGLISWDEYPSRKWPVHVDESGYKIGTGNCPRYGKQLYAAYNLKPTSYTKRVKTRSSTKVKVSPYMIIGIILLFLIPIGVLIGSVKLVSYPRRTGNSDYPYNPYDPPDDPPDDPTPPQNWEIDAEGTATYIVDGDTYDMTSIGRIRLADIDCPEQGESGYQAAKDYLNSLIYNEHVYIDIDDVYVTDIYGRTVAVTYVRYNSTHLLNVNKDLLVKGLAVIWNFDNEFNPYTWTLYVYYP